MATREGEPSALQSAASFSASAAEARLLEDNSPNNRKEGLVITVKNNLSPHQKDKLDQLIQEGWRKEGEVDDKDLDSAVLDSTGRKRVA